MTNFVNMQQKFIYNRYYNEWYNDTFPLRADYHWYTGLYEKIDFVNDDIEYARISNSNFYDYKVNVSDQMYNIIDNNKLYIMFMVININIWIMI